MNLTNLAKCATRQGALSWEMRLTNMGKVLVSVVGAIIILGIFLVWTLIKGLPW